MSLDFFYHFIAIYGLKLGLSSRKDEIGVKWKMLCPIWPWHVIEWITVYASWRFVHHSTAICEFKLELSPVNAEIRVKWAILWLVWTWNWTDDIERQYAPRNFSHHFMACEFQLQLWSVNRQIRAKIVLTSVTLNFDLDLFDWTLLLSMVMNFILIRSQEHCQKCVTNGQTEEQTDEDVHRAAQSQLNMVAISKPGKNGWSEISIEFELRWEGCCQNDLRKVAVITRASFGSGPVFCLLLGVSSDYAQPITGQVTEATCPVIGQAQSELTPSKRQKTDPGVHLTIFQVTFLPETLTTNSVNNKALVVLMLQGKMQDLSNKFLSYGCNVTFLVATGEVW